MSVSEHFVLVLLGLHSLASQQLCRVGSDRRCDLAVQKLSCAAPLRISKLSSQSPQMLVRVCDARCRGATRKTCSAAGCRRSWGLVQEHVLNPLRCDDPLRIQHRLWCKWRGQQLPILGPPAAQLFHDWLQPVRRGQRRSCKQCSFLCIKVANISCFGVCVV